MVKVWECHQVVGAVLVRLAGAPVQRSDADVVRRAIGDRVTADEGELGGHVGERDVTCAELRQRKTGEAEPRAELEHALASPQRGRSARLGGARREPVNESGAACPQARAACAAGDTRRVRHHLDRLGPAAEVHREVREPIVIVSR